MLIGDPGLLVVDEPTAGVDPEERIRFRNILADLSGEDKTVILSTHIVGDKPEVYDAEPVEPTLEHAYVYYHESRRLVNYEV